MQLLASVKDQTLSVLNDSGEVSHCYAISTARNGTGEKEGSYCTPLGKFEIAEKHGGGAPIGTIFRSRKPEGIWQPEHRCDSDLVLTRILWLQGLEQHNANTKQRYIYIHGTNHEKAIGTPSSAGCIRMHNSHIVELYDLIEVGTLLSII